MTTRTFHVSDHRVILTIGDGVAVTAAVLLSFWLWSITAGFPFSTDFVYEHRIWFLAIAAWGLALIPAFSPRAVLSPGDTIFRLLQAAGLLLVGYLLLYFYSPRQELPRRMALYVIWEGLLLVLAWRLTCAWLLSRTAFARRVLVVGAGDAGRTAVRLLRDFDFRNSTVVALLDLARPAREQRIDTVPVMIGGTLLDRVREVNANEIVLASPEGVDELSPALVECQEMGVEIVTMPQLYEDLLHRVPVHHLGSSWLFTSFVESIRANDPSRIAKRAVDIVGGLIGLIVLAALAPLVAAAIVADSRRPVFYLQQRTGRGGRTFWMWKFRTMVQDAEREGGPQWSGPGDPRVTRVGRILRRLRLDELPNLINVLRGDMSLVGPRPERPELVSLLAREIPFYRTRLLVRPGLTGWAQVNRPYGYSVEGSVEKLEYDLYYLRHRSLWFDLRILLRTVGTVVGLKGR